MFMMYSDDTKNFVPNVGPDDKRGTVTSRIEQCYVLQCENVF